ncbi:Gamma-glutamyltranspeptidase 1 [Bulinus truncatus]|nr:Gamma-glutamyltranspeptidase 1 [Bulinus truncatus]
MYEIIVLIMTYCSPLVISIETNQHGQEGHYRFAAVATKSSICSKVGTEIMARSGGNVVDAAVATLACVGVDTFQSSGLGGDCFWTYYERKTGKVYNILARSMAPLASNSTMYVNRTGATLEGGLSIAVPGELLGSWEAHKRFGKLPWKDLFQPAIKYAEEGFQVEKSLDGAIQKTETSGIFDRWPVIKSILTNPRTNTTFKEGEVIKLPLLARTLKRVAEGGAPEFYNGTLADDIVEEIQQAGGIITKEDLRRYTVDVTEPLVLNIHGNYTMFSPPLPSGGPVLQYILNILNGYKMSSDDISTYSKTVTTFHRLIEAYKHAFAARSEMGSTYGETPEFVEQMRQLVARLTTPSQGEAIRSRISDCSTFNYTSYNPSFVVQEDRGTSHISILGPNGDAVAVTATVNGYFGSKVAGPKTGLLYNNMMDDFSVPGLVNLFGVQPSPANYVKPRKRPLSSMSPSIVVNNEGMPVLVVGCSGGTRIITTNAYLTAMTLWLEEGIKSAIDAPRLHHQLFPNRILVQSAPRWLRDGLEQKGHVVVNDTSETSFPNGILQRQFGMITADSHGYIVDGY